jgi:uncharacterized protein YjbI with pentapeptide repeats
MLYIFPSFSLINIAGFSFNYCDYSHSAMIRKCDFTNADLSGASFGRTLCKKCVFAKADLSAIHGEMPVFQKCALTESARIHWTFFDRTTCVEAVFRSAQFLKSVGLEANLTGADLQNAVLERLTVRKAVLEDVILVGVTFDRVNLSAAKLAGHDFSGQKLRAVNFMGADLSGVSFKNADISTCVFQGACLTSALLEGVTARQCMFSDANLENVQALEGDFAQSFFGEASLSHADLSGSDFSRANLYLACMHICLKMRRLCSPDTTPSGIYPDRINAWSGRAFW